MIQQFLAEVEAVYKTGKATEHSYRPALQKLFNDLSEDIRAVNEPGRVKVGAPDFVFLDKQDIAIGHCEAKDLKIDLKIMKGYAKDQKTRYLNGFQNLIYTNCLEWRFYREGELLAEIRIADYMMGIEPRADQFDRLLHQLHDFVKEAPQTIRSAKKLAARMAGKAQLIKDVLEQSLIQDEEDKSELYGQYEAFQEYLIKDISKADFADVYAETIAYGMFAARLNDTTLEDFSREEALQLIPKSNPFLRNLFTYIAGPSLDYRLIWIIDDLARIFQATDLPLIMQDFGQATMRSDPFLHFYEDFLAAYNPQKRDLRGVWYTPEPVVDFIIRAVDDVLKSEFGVADGLADNRKIQHDSETGSRTLHRVQILDPAAGTGTFLARAIQHIAPAIKAVAPGHWSQYVETDLIPRLHGFELLMASYAMCHMKLEMVLREEGYKESDKPPRMSVYLTNSLEDGDKESISLPFAHWLANEANSANRIKRDQPIMCIIGNPPYRGESQNKSDWIRELMTAYKKEPGGRSPLQERNSKWINDDYVKFIRMSESLIEKNGEGILGFITNHGYLDNPTFRGMRWHLLKTFDKIYVLDLHGNAKKKEVAPDGSADKNVFDIQQGVAIIIAVKKKTDPLLSPRQASETAPLAKIYHSDFWGSRAEKYQALNNSQIKTLDWTPLEMRPPRYPFVERDWELAEKYLNGFRLNDFMPLNSVGIVTARDHFTIDEDRENLWKRIEDFKSLDTETARAKYSLGKDVRDWKVAFAQKDIEKHFEKSKLTQINYRPFDLRWTYYSGKTKGFMCYPRNEVMQNYLKNDNIGLLASKAVRDRCYAHIFVTSHISEAIFLSGTTATNAINFPLYYYDDIDNSRRINFDHKLHQKLKALATHPDLGVPNEVAIFDYIYGVLHCPAYRETYAAFLKIDFPRIPWPQSPDMFWSVSNHGTKLRRLHLMEPEAVGETPHPFIGEGDGVVSKPVFKDGQVWINQSQYFDQASPIAWGFYIGGYQPAQKWLKDRKGRALSFEDIRHYQRILKILSETDRIMQGIEFAL